MRHLIVALAAGACLLAAGAARATGSAHVEWQRGDQVYGSQTISSSSGVAAETSPAPSFGGIVAQGTARISATAGAVIVTWGPSAVATQTNGVRLQVGMAPLLVAVNVGDEVSIIEATDPPAGDPADAAYLGAVALTVGTADTAPRRGVQMNCTVAGNVVLTLADGSTDTVPVNTGLNIVPFSATEVMSGGTTATCTYDNLK